MDGLRTMISILQQFIAFKQDKTSTGQAYCLGILKGGVQLKYNDKTTVRLTLFHENCSLNSKLETRNSKQKGSAMFLSKRVFPNSGWNENSSIIIKLISGKYLLLPRKWVRILLVIYINFKDKFYTAKRIQYIDGGIISSLSCWACIILFINIDRACNINSTF